MSIMENYYVKPSAEVVELELEGPVLNDSPGQIDKPGIAGPPDIGFLE